ncbi:caspase domain-containing protein [Armillaria borealis]|uniref:Caspase domain-containing protein n=1 Tax=Armillaria borealis TaxID=47425 RepID=A0AA39JZ87_9AGAR|nr:caspase domain-containing protein [Armillaria borealis]
MTRQNITMTLGNRCPCQSNCGRACAPWDSDDRLDPVIFDGPCKDEAERPRSAKVIKTNENFSKQLLAPRSDILCTENARVSSGSSDSDFEQNGMADDTTGILTSGPDNTIGDSQSERGSDKEETGTLSASESWMGAANTVADATRTTVPSLQKLPTHDEVIRSDSTSDYISNNSFDVGGMPPHKRIENVDHRQNQVEFANLTETKEDGRDASKVPQTHAIFALVMGISEYRFMGYENLQGAANDADKFEGYLREDLQAPEENIISLRDAQATRSAIIDEFTNLIQNPNIVCGRAAIVIYFAGHGAVANKPGEWTDWETSDNTIEMLCPADMGLLDEYNNVIEGIPDRTISELLLRLSEAKGNNITVVLDCCHAAGINRGLQHPDAQLRSRRILHPPQISPKCDSTISSRRSRGITSGFSGSSWDSHIVLAACSRHQFAWEEDGQGIFTRALLKVMRRTPSRRITYKSLMHRLVMPPFQTPHLEGKHLHRFLFDSSQDPAENSRILCRREDGQSHFTLYAGSLHGITKGSTFGIYLTDLASDSHSLSTAVVDEVGTFVSYLTPSDPALFATVKNRRVWYARLIEVSEACLLIHCYPPALMTRILTEDQEPKFTVLVCTTKDPDQADLCIVLERRTVYFERGRRNSLSNPCVGFSPRLSYFSSIDDVTGIRRIIDHFAHFTSHLMMGSPLPMSDFASIEMKRLAYVGSNLCLDGENLLSAVEAGKYIQLDVDTSLPPNQCPSYGFTIQNESDVNLYVYLFYFDASTLEIGTH